MGFDVYGTWPLALYRGYSIDNGVIDGDQVLEAARALQIDRDRNELHFLYDLESMQDGEGKPIERELLRRINFSIFCGANATLLAQESVYLNTVGDLGLGVPSHWRHDPSFARAAEVLAAVAGDAPSLNQRMGIIPKSIESAWDDGGDGERAHLWERYDNLYNKTLFSFPDYYSLQPNKHLLLEGPQQVQSKEQLRLSAIEFPFLADLPPKMLLEIQGECSESFLAFHNYLKASLRDAKCFSTGGEESVQYNLKGLMDGIRHMREELGKVKRKRWKSLTLFSISTASIYLTHHLNSGIADVVSGLLGSMTLADLGGRLRGAKEDLRALQSGEYFYPMRVLDAGLHSKES